MANNEFLYRRSPNGGHLLSPPQKLPLGIPIKISIIEKIESARGTMGRGKRREPLFSLPPSHRAPRALFFFLPSLPTTQKPYKRGLCGGESTYTAIKAFFKQLPWVPVSCQFYWQFIVLNYMVWVRITQAKQQTRVVQKLDSAIHWINHYPVDKYLGNQLHYPVDKGLSGG